MKKALLKKEKTKEVVKNDSALKSGFSLKDSKNEEKPDFLFKDLQEGELDSFCHAIANWQLTMSYLLAKGIFGENVNYEDNKKLKFFKQNIISLEKCI